jgi:hypothetical protein
MLLHISSQPVSPLSLFSLLYISIQPAYSLLLYLLLDTRIDKLVRLCLEDVLYRDKTTILYKYKRIMAD